MKEESKLNTLKNQLFDNMFELIKKFKYVIFIFWVVTSICCCYFAFETFTLTTTSFEAPKGSWAEASNKLYAELYPTHTDYEMTVIVTTKDDKTNINTPEYRQFIEELNSTVNQYNPQMVLSIYTQLDAEVNITKYLQENETALMIVNSFHEDAADLVRAVKKTIKEKNPEGYTTRVSGNTAGSLETSQLMMSDMKKMESIMIPIVILIFLYVIRNVVLVIIPLINLVIIFMTTFASINPIAKYSEYFSISPCINLSLIVAMSVDYSLF